MEKFAVIGYGSWATTLVRQLLTRKVQVNWLITNQEVKEGVIAEGRNPKYVPDAELDTETLSVFDDLNEAVKGCDYILLGCPSAYLKKILEPLSVDISDKFIISAIKGIVPDECMTVLEYIHTKYALPFKQLGVISGPTHAEEVSRDSISYLTAAGSTKETAEKIAGLFRCGKLHVDTSTDIYGIEYAGVLKNIYAIVAGIASGLGYGDNFIAVLVADSAIELKRFLNISYPFERITNSKAYLGDLLVTCYSNYSRNRRLGQLIGKGCTVKSALNEMTMTAEGYFSTKLIMQIKQKAGIDMPIADFAYKVLYENARPRQEMVILAEKL